MLALIVGQALFQSLSAWLTGAELKTIVPVFEAPIANAGKALGAALTAWIPAWSIPTPFGPIDVQKTVAQGLRKVHLWRWGAGRRSLPMRFFVVVLAALPPKPPRKWGLGRSPKD